MRWTILSGVVGALIYAVGRIWKGRQRPDIGKMITCMAYAATLPVSLIILVVAASGDHESLAAMAKEPEFAWYAGTAALVVLYHGLEHLYDEIKSALKANVTAAPPSEDQAGVSSPLPPAR